MERQRTEYSHSVLPSEQSQQFLIELNFHLDPIGKILPILPQCLLPLRTGPLLLYKFKRLLSDLLHWKGINVRQTSAFNTALESLSTSWRVPVSSCPLGNQGLAVSFLTLLPLLLGIALHLLCIFEIWSARVPTLAGLVVSQLMAEQQRWKKSR